MIPHRILVAAFVGACALSACKKHETATPAESASDAGASAAHASADAQGEASAPAFDLQRIPVSTVALGDFPYVGLPAGYVPLNPPETQDVDRFPFWTGTGFEWVEGRTWSTYLGTEGGKNFSPVEVKRNLDSVIASAGGVKVFDGQVPEKDANALGSDFLSSHGTGIGNIAGEPSTVYVIRRADRTIWIHLNTYSAGGSLTIAESQAFAPTAALLPASALKQQIDSSGSVSLQVNFATDRTEILPESQPQIDQVVQLLKDSPTLNLSVDGHTDNSGDAAHNLALSKDRAKAVVAALVAHGIDASRLSADGFGDTQPVSDNATDAGKARNRRVELVKRS